MKKNKKILLIAFLLAILTTIYIYICAVNGIPENIIIFKGDNINIKTVLGIDLNTEKQESILASSSLDENSINQNVGTQNVAVKLFNTFTVKNVSVSVLEKTTVIPIGQVAGLKLYTDGALVVGMSEIKGMDNQTYKPYENSGIEEGDRIIKVEDTSIKNAQELIDLVNASNGDSLEITYIKDEETLVCSINPVQSSDGQYKLGLWVRDSAAGIGTMTFYQPSTGKFAALGHGITDIDTGELIQISNGEFITTTIMSIVKGLAGNPGKIQGTIDSQTEVGKIYKNSNLGVYGQITDVSALNIDLSKEYEVATRDEIKLGKATVICSLDGNTAKEYEIEIEKIFLNNNDDNKSMLIKITDDELIEKTGGIIQGMSGAPIIQNGKFVGAVTHVLVNDSKVGYAVFADLMIKQMREVS